MDLFLFLNKDKVEPIQTLILFIIFGVKKQYILKPKNAYYSILATPTLHATANYVCVLHKYTNQCLYYINISHFNLIIV